MGQGGGMGNGQGGRVSLQGGVGGPMTGTFLVRPQPGELGVGTLANLALVGPLTGVQADVVTEGGGLAEATVAEAAHERLVQGVDAHVGAQVAAGVEAAVADDAAHAARGAGSCLHCVEVLWEQQGGAVRQCPVGSPHSQAISNCPVPQLHAAPTAVVMQEGDEELSAGICGCNRPASAPASPPALLGSALELAQSPLGTRFSTQHFPKGSGAPLPAHGSC